MRLDEKPIELPEVLIDALPVPERHGQVYPVHDDPKKGNIYGGECNRTACDNKGATFYNIGTFALYCKQDAEGINWRKHKPPLCVDLGKRPSLEEMNSLYMQFDFSQ